MDYKNIIFDNHVHTQFAYCSRNTMLPENTIKIAKDKGCGICIVEHSGQLYVTSEDYWNENVVNIPKLMYDPKTSRMDEYISYISKYKDENVKLGLELDINADGDLVLKEEHKDSFDMFLGAVHFIPKSFTDIDKGFMWNVDLFCDYKVDILAHPFRIYKKLNLNRPTHLYKVVAETLGKHGVAAEINFHTNTPDWEFFKICIDAGVKIAFGSDAHTLEEVCSFDKNIEMLNNIYKGSIDDILLNYDNGPSYD